MCSSRFAGPYAVRDCAGSAHRGDELDDVYWFGPQSEVGVHMRVANIAFLADDECRGDRKKAPIAAIDCR